MEYTIKTMAATTFLGATVRLKKNKVDKISEFWQYFSQNNIFTRIDSLLAPRVVAMYSDYNMPGEDCSFWLGGLVADTPKKSDILKFKKIPEQLYAVFVEQGVPSEITSNIWKEINQLDLDRSRQNDFEIYKPIGEGKFEIRIYVSLN